MSSSHRKRRSRRIALSQQLSAVRERVRPPQSWSLLAVDVQLALLIVVFPFIMGGREAWGHLTLITAALGLGCTWCLHRTLTGGRLVLTGCEPLILGAFSILWLQTAPIGLASLQKLSPEYDRLLDGWATTQQVADNGQSEAVWNTASLSPEETRHAAWILLSYVIIGSVIAQRVQTREDAERMIRLVAVSGTAMAAFAAVQLIFSNGRYFWFYRNPYTGTDELLKGAFTNRNHFAQFLTVAIGPLLWWLTRVRRELPPRAGYCGTSGGTSLFDRFAAVPLLMLLCASGGVVASVMLSLSRGGMIALSAASLTCLALLARQKQFRASMPMIILFLGTLIVGSLLVFGGQQVENRVHQLASADADRIDEMNCRRAIWAADFQAIQHFPLLGTGVGSHREVYPVYMEDLADFSDFEFTHAESTYIHLALETGFAGLMLLALGLLFLFCRLVFAMFRRRSQSHRDCLAPVLAALVGGSLHAFVDFIWYVPAIVIVTLALSVTGLRAAGAFSESRGLHLPRLAWAALLVLLAIGLVRVQPELWRRVQGEQWWHAYLVATFDEAIRVDQESERYADPDNQPVTDEGSAAEEINIRHSLAEVDEAVTQQPAESLTIRSMKRRVGLLMQSLQANPQQPRTQVRMASLCLKLFDQLQTTAENPMSLAEIRDSAIGAGFDSPDQLNAWLDRAFGRAIRLPRTADRLARDALRSSPLQGPAYLTLLETGFLRNPADPDQPRILDQALTLRGYDPRTRYLAGQVALYNGNQADALAHWNMVFHANHDFRQAITLILSRSVPASLLMQEFRPSVSELRDVLAAYSDGQHTRDVDQILFEVRRLTEQETDGVTAADRVALLMDAYKAAWDARQSEVAEEMLRRAIACDDLAYWPRHALGLLMFETNRYEEASELFAWCYSQQPGDTKLERLIRDARRQALQQSRSVMSTSWRRE